MSDLKFSAFGRSLRGENHFNEDKVCQDYMQIMSVENKVVIIVADGREEEYSVTGSRIAGELFEKEITELIKKYKEKDDQLMSYLENEGQKTLAKSIEKNWKAQVKVEYRSTGKKIAKRKDGTKDNQSMFRQFGTSLLGLVIDPNFIFTFQIGDGDMLYAAGEHAGRLFPDTIPTGKKEDTLNLTSAWQKCHTSVRRIHIGEEPVLFAVASGGYTQGFEDSTAMLGSIQKLKNDIKETDPDTVYENLEEYLRKISKESTKDDITLLLGYLERADAEAEAQESIFDRAAAQKEAEKKAEKSNGLPHFKNRRFLL